eukprot:c23679_g1_i1 orf=347-1123(+)
MDISRRAFDVILMSGQSNMSGRGGIQVKHLEDGSVYKAWDRIVPSECEAEKGTILRLAAALEWEEAQEPLHEDIDTGKICGVGPGLVFATTVLQYYKTLGESVPAIGLVPCAVGGTQIKEWEKGGHLYDQMIQRATVASKRGTLRALLWYQGESDTLAAENAVEFQQRLKTLITNVRSDLHIENLPVIQVGITAVNHPFPELLEKVRQAQLALELPGVFYVDASGLPLLEDNIHLNLEAQIKLGKMLADVYIKCILVE